VIKLKVTIQEKEGHGTGFLIPPLVMIYQKILNKEIRQAGYYFTMVRTSLIAKTS